MKYAALLASFLFPSIACAASLSLAPASVALSPGESVTLDLIADPQGATIASIRADIAFDPSLLQETSFAFLPGWLALVEPGYDSVDNTNGAVVKTAGYPGGVERPVRIATITLQARKAGQAAVVIAGDTQMLDGEGADQFAGGAGGAVITIAGSYSAKAAQDMPSVTPIHAAAQSAAASSTLATSSLAAAAALAPLPFSTSSILLALACFALGALGAYLYTRRSPGPVA
jgi:hypothetical protein